ncbi:MAG TPA: hypothetical protein VF210_18665 [Pseudomonadales bacterium]
MSEQKQSVRVAVLIAATGLAIAVGVGVAMHRHQPESAPPLPDTAAADPAGTTIPAEAPATTIREHSALFSSGGERPIEARTPDATETRLEKLEGLVGEIAREQRQLTAVIARLAAGETEAEPKPAAPLSPVERAQLADQQALDQANYVSETHLEEAVDPDWAPEAQESVYAMFADEALEGFTLTSADCRASLCRIEMGLDEAIPGPEAFRKLQQNTPWDGAGFVEITMDPPGAVLYLAREGASIPEMSDSAE